MTGALFDMLVGAALIVGAALAFLAVFALVEIASSYSPLRIAVYVWCAASVCWILGEAIGAAKVGHAVSINAFAAGFVALTTTILWANEAAARATLRAQLSAGRG